MILYHPVGRDSFLLKFYFETVSSLSKVHSHAKTAKIILKKILAIIGVNKPATELERLTKTTNFTPFNKI